MTPRAKEHLQVVQIEYISARCSWAEVGSGGLRAIEQGAPQQKPVPKALLILTKMARFSSLKNYHD